LNLRPRGARARWLCVAKDKLTEKPWKQQKLFLPSQSVAISPMQSRLLGSSCAQKVAKKCPSKKILYGDYTGDVKCKLHIYNNLY
jgi:hypothetical protein